MAFGLGTGDSARGREAPFASSLSAAKRAAAGLINRKEAVLEDVEGLLRIWTAPWGRLPGPAPPVELWDLRLSS